MAQVMLLRVVSTGITWMILAQAAGADPVRFRVVPLTSAGNATAINTKGSVTVSRFPGAMVIDKNGAVEITGVYSAWGINDHGAVTGETLDGSAFVWSGASLQKLSPENRGTGYSINNSDVVAGELVTDNRIDAVVWRGQVAERIVPGNPLYSGARAINNGGTVAGSVDYGDGLGEEAFRWSKTQGFELLGRL